MKLKYHALIAGLFLFVGLNSALADNIKTNTGLKVEGNCSIITTYTVNIAQSPKIGTYLTGPNGMTLYYLEDETDNNIKCANQTCLAKWPIFYEKELALPGALKSKDFKIFKRPDGKLQISYNNKPLYFFAMDKRPGEAFGNDLRTPVGIWHVIKIEEK
ncbi:putative lipoprotein [Desulfurella amilsii]|uniref:Putative lipoprotein n=1 Tax=Desulfurella amilsii TaxID=1562698 RepID=A0A1X4XV46_9BACT|nr:hypothetical protein [Desulfurella amilsii]OSS41413.1 putative lipoprotein [Desulfurella amilsii]